MYAFIGGTPATGKSTLARKFPKESGLDVVVVPLDDLRHEMISDPKLQKWVNLFRTMDEKKYWKTATFNSDTALRIKQCEAFFPTILAKVKEVTSQYQHAVFEGVYILPHLVRKSFNFPGFYLVCDDYSTLLNRLRAVPRWGKTEELQQMEARHFIDFDARLIKEQAAKYGYKVFDSSTKGEKELDTIFNIRR